jgi:hypothetical protein
MISPGANNSPVTPLALCQPIAPTATREELRSSEVGHPHVVAIARRRGRESAIRIRVALA